MAPRRLSRFNIGDPDIVSGSVRCFLSCLSINGPTAPPFDLHSVTCVPFSFLTLFSRLYLSLASLCTHALIGLALSNFIGRLPLVHRRYIPDFEIPRL